MYCLIDLEFFFGWDDKAEAAFQDLGGALGAKTTDMTKVWLLQEFWGERDIMWHHHVEVF